MSDRKDFRYNSSQNGTFRSFIALDIQPDAKNELSRVSAILKQSCHGSFVSQDMYHMTIAFLGDITILQEQTLVRVLGNVAAKYSPFDLTLCRLGYFAQPESATVFVSTARDNTLLSLASDVYRAAWDCRIGFDDKPFRAHITLGRRIDLSSIRLNSIDVNPISFTVNGLSIYKSTLKPSGPVYDLIDKISFNKN